MAGFNSRLDEMQAAFLRVKLRQLDKWNLKRGEIAAYYNNLLSGNSRLLLPRTAEWAEHAWHQYVVRLENRDGLMKHLEGCGIETLIHYPIAPHQSAAYSSQFRDTDNYPLTSRFAKECLSLPMGPHLSKGNIEYICKNISGFFDR